MGDTGYGLSPELFRAVFPFHIVLDRGLRIRQLGRVFERICPLLREGRPITDYFDLKRPVIPFTFEGIRQASRSLFLLVCKRKTMELRGEMCHPPGTDLLYFLGTPWITRIDQLGTLGLTLDDFPIHDPIADLLFLIQSQHNTIESTRKLTEELRRQREELRRINRNLALQSQVNRIFTENLPPKELFFRLLGVIGESLGCVAGNVWEEEGQWRASAVWRRFDAPATPSSCRTQASPPLAEYLDRIAGEEGIFQDSLEPVIAGEMPGIERLPRGEERSGSSRPASEMFGFPVRIGGKTAALFTFLADAPLCLEESISDTIRDIALRLGREFDRRRAEAALAESEARRQESEKKYRILWENAPEAVLLLDPSGGIRFANPAVTSIFGYPPEEIAGASILRLIAPHCAEGEGEPPPEKLLSRLLSGKRREFLARRKGGERFPIETSLCEMEIAGNATWALFIRDITERKKVERMKNEFVSIVSHELRTPLTSIRGALGLIEGGAAGELSPSLQRLIEIACKNCDRLVRLINDILDVERIESGKIRIDRKPQPIMSLIERALEENAAYGTRFGVHFRLCAGVPGVEAAVDGDRFIQLLTNLLGNAAKFSPPGAEVEVRALRNNGSIRVEVTDHGPGIPKPFHAKIFEKFVQVDSSDQRPKEGAGLGLSIARAIVRQFGGEIGFETEAGKGTTFFFELPEHRSAEEGAGKGAPRILLCEDDPHYAELLRILLEEDGFLVDLARDAAQARSLCAGKDYAAMILDLFLPDRHGLDLLRELQEDPGVVTPPVIVVSVAASRHRNAVDLPEPVSAWIDKPVERTRLIEALYRTIGERRGRPRILHIDDDPDILELVSAILRETAEVFSVRSLADEAAWLKRISFDMVILDIELGEGSGLDLLPLIEEEQGIPVVLFSAYELPPGICGSVAALVVKSQHSNEHFAGIIRAILERDHALSGRRGSHSPQRRQA